MSFSNFARDTSELIIEKYWQIYRITDEKRIKSFYYLISIVFFSVLLIHNNNLKEVPLLGMVIQRESALYVFPAVIFILSLRYFFLSALSLGNHYKFSKYFEGFKSKPEKDLDDNETKSSYNYNPKYYISEFKSDDVNELPNMFLFPIQLDNSGYIKSAIREFLKPTFSLAFFVLHSVALDTYIYLYYSNKNFISGFYLLFLGTVLIAAITYFFYKTKPVRIYFNKKQLEFRALSREKKEDKIEQAREENEENIRSQKMLKYIEPMETRQGQISAWIITLIVLFILLYFILRYLIS